jgi:trigger factor
LTGVRPDEERTFTIAYPEDFSSKGLAGKTIEYTAKVVAVRRKEQPELDDEFAKGLGEEGIETMETLRARIRETLEARANMEADTMVQGELMDQLISAHQFEVPASLVQMQTRRLLEQTVRDMYSRGLDPRGGELDWANMRTGLEQQSIADLRGSILLERIADEEAIEVSDEEVEAEIERVATVSRKSVDEIRDALTKQGGDRSIADRLRNRKALDLLTSSAQIRDEEWREEEPPVMEDTTTEATTEAQADDTTSDAPKTEEAGA